MGNGTDRPAPGCSTAGHAAGGGDPLLTGVWVRLALAAVLAAALWAGLWGLGVAAIVPAGALA